MCEGTHRSLVNHSFVGSAPQQIPLGAADVPVDPDLPEGARVSVPRGDFHLSPHETCCGHCLQFANRDLVPEGFRMKSRSGDA